MASTNPETRPPKVSWPLPNDTSMGAVWALAAKNSLSYASPYSIGTFFEATEVEGDRGGRRAEAWAAGGVERARARGDDAGEKLYSVLEGGWRVLEGLGGLGRGVWGCLVEEVGLIIYSPWKRSVRSAR
jgi:hypothetical protein